MEIEVGTFLEKFEKAFGSKLTRCLVGLVGLAVGSAALGLIWSGLAHPVLAMLRRSTYAPPLEMAQWATLALAVLVVVSICASFLRQLNLSRANKRLDAIIEQARLLISEQKILLEESNVELQNARESSRELANFTTQAQLILEEILSAAVNGEPLSVKQVDDFKWIASVSLKVQS